MNIKKLLINFTILAISTFIAFIVGELVYRTILFGNNPKFSSIRKPELYADYFNDDDYWKLYHIFGGEYGPPNEPHPLLGWIGKFDRKSYRHNEADSAKAKRKVLLYGDSFAECVPEAECFQSLLNNDSAFSANHYLLNYGVGGYGVDQIQLLFESSYNLYEKPFVVLSIMTSDMDRTPLTNRIGQKPYYEIQDDSLLLKGVPIMEDPEAFFERNPPSIKSYLWQRLLFTPRNPLPDSWKAWLKGETPKTEYKKKLNIKVLQKAIDELRRTNTDFVFLVFHYVQKGNPVFNVDGANDWRDAILKDFIAQNNIPYIWSKDLIRNDSLYNGVNIDKYMIESNGHPTTYFNQLIAQEIKKHVLSTGTSSTPTAP